MDILGKFNSPKIYTNNLNTVDMYSEGFVWKVPKLTADLMRAQDAQKHNKTVMMPLNRELGRRLNLLA